MKILHICFMVVVSISFMPCPGYAQAANAVERSTAFDSITLPPLSMLIDSAIAHNAMLKFFEHSIDAKKSSLSAESKSWTKSFGIQADVRYGSFNNFSTNTAEGQSPSLIATSTNQTNFGVGAYVKLPLSDFVNRKNFIQLAKAEVHQAESMAKYNVMKSGRL